jgi:hypothetical protein
MILVTDVDFLGHELTHMINTSKTSQPLEDGRQLMSKHVGATINK